MIEPIGIKIEVRGDAYWENPREHAIRCMGEFSMMNLIDRVNSREQFHKELPMMRRCGKTFWATYEALRQACFGKTVVIVTYSLQCVDSLVHQIQKHIDLGLQKLGVKIRRCVKTPDALIEIESPFRTELGRIFFKTEGGLREHFFCGRDSLNLIDDQSDCGADLYPILKDYQYKIDSYVTALDLLKRAIKESK